MKIRIGIVAIHNKNGKGLLQIAHVVSIAIELVAIHNKNGKGLLHNDQILQIFGIV